jgi:hypothetical protein
MIPRTMRSPLPASLPAYRSTARDGLSLSLARLDPADVRTAGQYFEDRTSHKFMDVLAKSGVKPVWVERSAKIKDMQSKLLRRVKGESTT